MQVGNSMTGKPLLVAKSEREVDLLDERQVIQVLVLLLLPSLWMT